MTRAPEIDRPGLDWLNTDQPLGLGLLRGQLVLLDFWTFCCVNCLHIISLLRHLEQEFGGRLVVIGIHSPKFRHEGNLDQLRHALRRYDIQHPVIHDPELRLWGEYAIRAWPTLVLVSTDGYIIGHYPGEPAGDSLEALIRQSLESASVKSRPRFRQADLPEVQVTTASAFKYPSKIKPVAGESMRWAVTDTGHHQVALLNDDGAVLERHGSGEKGFVDGARGTGRLNGPEGLCCSASTIYVADTRNHAIRSIELSSGRLSTVAGTGARGVALTSYWSRGARLALASPWDIELVGDRLFFANAGTHQLGELRLCDGYVRNAAGTGREGIQDGPALSTQLAQPSGLAYDADSQLLYFVDSETSSVRFLNLRTRWVESLIGLGLFAFGDDIGSFSEALLQHPLGITVCDNQLYVADTYNNKIKVLDLAGHRVSNLEEEDYACTDSLCLSMAEPSGVACTAGRRLLVVDTNNHRVLKYDQQSRTCSTWGPAPVCFNSDPER
jgi:thiol-disulfide isomerase/thioredoxin